MGLAGVLADTLGTRTVFVLSGALVSVAGIVAMLIFRGATMTLPPEDLSSFEQQPTE